MKAEHRKELQTNALADRMGRVIQKMKQRPSRGSLLTWVLVGVVVLAVLFFFWRRNSALEREAQRWVLFDEGQDRFLMQLLGKMPEQHLEAIAQNYAGTAESRAAQAEVAWTLLYELGIKDLQNPDAPKMIQNARARYQRLLDEAKDDPVLGPEASYAIAVAEEALTIPALDKIGRPTLPAGNLTKAAKLYRAVANTYPKSALAQRAEKRAKQLEDGKERQRIESFYQALSSARQRWVRGQFNLQHMEAPFGQPVLP